MITNFSKQLTISAVSAVSANTQTGTTDVPINYLQATVPSDGRFTVNQVIQDEKLYFENLEIAKADYDAFYDHVINLAKDTKTPAE